MSSESKFLYKLGHVKNLSEAEFLLSGGEINNIYNGEWLASNSDLKVNLMGSISLKAEIIREFEKNENTKTRILDGLEAFLLSNPRKKVGFLMPGFDKNELIKLAKKCKSKKINAKNTGNLNYGHWKQVKSWIITIETESKIILAEVVEMFDQEFFSVLDNYLPEKDMARGMINLKLARTLLNMTKGEFVWDPFAGVGRIPISGVDIKKEFFSSDIDSVCLPQIQKNYEAALNVWKRNIRFKFKNTEPEFAKLTATFEHDATKYNKDFQSNIDLVVVTEGFLGKNFKRKPEVEEAQEELEKVELIWQEALKCFQEYGVKEVVFCLPFYEWKDKELHPDLDTVLAKSNYKVVKMVKNQDFILYKRKDTFTGHAIIKLSA